MYTHMPREWFLKLLHSGYESGKTSAVWNRKKSLNMGKVCGKTSAVRNRLSLNMGKVCGKTSAVWNGSSLNMDKAILYPYLSLFQTVEVLPLSYPECFNYEESVW